MNWKDLNICMYNPQHTILDTDKENDDERILCLIVSAFPKRKKKQNTPQVLLEKDNPWILASNITQHEMCRYLWNKNYTQVWGHTGIPFTFKLKLTDCFARVKNYYALNETKMSA